MSMSAVSKAKAKQPHEEAEEEEEDEDDDEEVGLSELDVETELSSFALDALKQHLAEAEAEEKRWCGKDGASLQKENFGLAQFWYTSDTSRELLLEVVSHCSEDDDVVAVLSAPSLMSAAQTVEEGKYMKKVRIFEIDERFGVQWPDNFHRYDFNEAEVLPTQLLGKCAAVFLDPPYLNEETLREYFVSSKLLLRPNKDNDEAPTPIIVVTAAILEDVVREAFGLRPVPGLEIEHTTKLGNPLRAYTNYRPRHLNPASWDQ